MRNKFKQEYQKREEEVLKYILSRGSSGQDVNKRIRSKLGKIAEMKESSGKRTQLLKLLSDEIENAGKMDTSYFSVMEMDLDTDHQAQVNAALEQFMAKANLAKKSE